jgi:hypothetical protein
MNYGASPHVKVDLQNYSFSSRACYLTTMKPKTKMPHLPMQQVALFYNLYMVTFFANCLVITNILLFVGCLINGAKVYQKLFVYGVIKTNWHKLIWFSVKV